ncbi:MAG: hypothetical protein Q9213_001826 [Squamulea squamosa]
MPSTSASLLSEQYLYTCPFAELYSLATNVIQSKGPPGTKREVAALTMDDPLGPPQKLRYDPQEWILWSEWVSFVNVIDVLVQLRPSIWPNFVSGVVGGIIIFSTSGEILAIAGPAGVLTAFAVVGVITISVMEGLSEMIELWPVSNAMMEFVKAFVDEDLATVVGYFGYIECVAGVIKTIFVIGGIVLLYALAGQDFEAGFQSVPGIAENPAAAVCIAIPVVVYGFMGVEIIAVTAFEARNPKALRLPAKWIAYICCFLKLFLVLGEVLTVHWKDPALHQLD